MILLKIIAAIALLTAAFFLCSEYERRHPVVHSYRVRSAALPESFSGVRIAYLADLHGQNPGKAQERTEALLRESDPDLVLIGGDMITARQDMELDTKPLEGLLNAVPAGVPVYYADGNHETRIVRKRQYYPGWVEELDRVLKEYGVVRVQNGRLEICRGEERITLSSADLPIETYHRKFRVEPLREGFFPETLGEKPEGYEIMLLHSPLYMEEACAYGADLVLSGHFHGGTVRLFGRGVMTPQFQLFNRYCRGLFRFGEGTGIVSGGLGTHTIDIRFMNRPEIVLLTLEKETQDRTL